MLVPLSSATRFASLGLIAIIMGLGVFAIGSSVTTESEASKIEASGALSRAYDHVRQIVHLETRLQYEYWATRDPSIRTEFYRTAGLLTPALRSSGSGATPSSEDRRLAGTVGWAQHRYLNAVRLLFGAITRGNMRQARVLNAGYVVPTLRYLDRAITSEVGQEAHEMSIATTNLYQTSVVLRTATFVAYPLGLLLIILLWAVVHSYRQGIDRAQAAERQRLATEALTDFITGIGNHRAFQETFHRELGHAQRHGHPVSLALLDLDDFKLVNDRHGHSQGDQVLASFATLLRSQRAGDLTFRLGGDEFAVILRDTKAHDAALVMERLRSQAQQLLPDLTMSIGVVEAQHALVDASMLRDQADAALYQAKRQGRNQVVCFADIEHGFAAASTAKIAGLRRLLAEHDVSAVFQPIWHLGRDAILGYEALTRPSSDYGLDGPQEAFDLAEQIGRTPELDLICREAILARARELPPGALLFMNLAPQSLDHPLTAGKTLLDAVEAAGLHPSLVVLEVTEQSGTRLSTVVREVQRFRELGFQVALDDVGAGNAGLEMLRQMAVDFVKIDRRVVIEAMSNTSAAGVFAAIIAFAQRTGIPVIAEGIETETMLEALQRIGDSLGSTECPIQAVQGYLFGKPSATLPVTLPGDAVVLPHLRLGRRDGRAARMTG